jgi:hypothetical protein
MMPQFRVLGTRQVIDPVGTGYVNSRGLAAVAAAAVAAAAVWVWEVERP